jgi:CheY-like chemotaxis protein
MRLLAAPVILIVDDDTGIRNMLTAVYTMEGYRIETATNGREALERLKRRGPYIVLLGLMMPYMTGEEVLLALKQTPEVRRQHWITLMSAYPDVDKIAVAAGADASLTKPFSLDQLLSLLSGGLAHLRQVHEADIVN